MRTRIRRFQFKSTACYVWTLTWTTANYPVLEKDAELLKLKIYPIRSELGLGANYFRLFRSVAMLKCRSFIFSLVMKPKNLLIAVMCQFMQLRFSFVGKYEADMKPKARNDGKYEAEINSSGKHELEPEMKPPADFKPLAAARPKQVALLAS